MDATLKFIGKVHSPLKSLADCPLQEREAAPEASVEIFEDFKTGTRNIKAGEALLLFTWLHEADRSVVECVTRKNFDSPPVGVFSTRSPDRPNPIGVHQVKVLSINNGMMKVSALEVLDQTPVIDIKPVTI